MHSSSYFKGLDVLRFIAATLVLLAHAHFQLQSLKINWNDNLVIMHLGKFAVLFFFVLSGFLLTTLGIQEEKSNGTINLKRFYQRRIARIWPLYYLCLLLSLLLIFVLFPIFYPSYVIQFPPLPGIICTVLFFPNFLSVNKLTNIGSITNTWSIGVEEIFYSFFPLLLLLSLRLKKNYIIVFSVALLVWLAFSYSFRYLSSLLPAHLRPFIQSYSFQYMLIGCLFAAIEIKLKSNMRTRIISGVIEALIGFVIITIIANRVRMPIWIADLMWAVLYSIIILFTIRLGNRFFQNTPLVYFGKISYGIYLLHPFVSYLLRYVYTKSTLFAKMITNEPSVYFLLLVVLSLIAAHISYISFEKRFLKLVPSR